MPIATITSITRIEDLTEYWLQKLDDSADDLGFNFIGGYDEPIKLAYPAVVVGAGAVTREVHATHVFLNTFTLDFFVTHAEASVTHRKRSLENLQQVSKLVSFLEADMTLGDKVIFGYVVSERPGFVQPRTAPTKLLVSTIITYQAILETIF